MSGNLFYLLLLIIILYNALLISFNANRSVSLPFDPGLLQLFTLIYL